MYEKILEGIRTREKGVNLFTFLYNASWKTALELYYVFKLLFIRSYSYENSCFEIHITTKQVYFPRSFELLKFDQLVRIKLISFLYCDLTSLCIHGMGSNLIRFLTATTKISEDSTFPNCIM